MSNKAIWQNFDSGLFILVPVLIALYAQSISPSAAQSVAPTTPGVLSEAARTNAAAAGLDKVSELIGEKRFAEAKQILIDMAKFDPNLNTTLRHSKLAKVYEQMGDKESQINEYEILIQLKPAAKSIDTRLALSRAYSSVGRPEDSIRQLRKAIEIEPSCSLCHLNLGIKLQNKGLAEESLAELQTAKQAGEKDRELYRLMANSYSDMGDFSSAAECLERFIDENPSSPRIPEEEIRLQKFKGLQKAIQVSSESPDYLADCIANGVTAWSAEKQVLLIYFRPVGTLPGYRQSMQFQLEQALQEWQSVLSQRFTFQLSPREEGADMVFQFVDKIGSTESGLTDLITAALVNHPQTIRIKHTTIRISVRAVDTNEIQSDLSIKQTSLHEIGHAFGLSHSGNAHDQMFFQRVQSRGEHLTQRDKETACRLYGIQTNTPPNFTSMMEQDFYR